MAHGIPVRLSPELTARARDAAGVLDRSLTEQVEHWARLGQIVEEAIGVTAVRRLKACSYDPELPARLAKAQPAEGRAAAAAVIRARNPVRFARAADGSTVRRGRRGPSRR